MLGSNRYMQWILIAVAVSLSLLNSRILPVQAKEMNGPMSAAWSPDGKQILATIAQTEESWSLYVLDVDTGKQTRIADDAYESSWSPDGKQIVYSGRETSGVVVINADGSHPKQVASDGFSPTWSPDGKEIRFLSLNSIATFDIGSQKVQLVTEQKGQNFVYYSWSPDQKQLAFTTFRDTGPNTAYLMNADGAHPRKLAESSRGGDIAWAPNGKHLATGSRCGDNEGLCIWDADGLNPHLIVKDGENQQWSPDSRRLAYVLAGKICVVNVDGSQQQCLTQDATGSRPLWSPNGKQIMFIATTMEIKDNDMKMTTKLNVVNADGTGFTQLVP